MRVISDILLVAGALGAGFYCYILARRLARFNDLENGIGGAVAVLSAQVDDLAKTLVSAQKTASTSNVTLEGLTDRAETVAKRLELLVASMHDLPAEPQRPQTPTNTQDDLSLKVKAEPVFMRHRAAESGRIR
ncbi:MAG: hypothetical protein P8N68_11445 [Paracoccaceae bacterium]|nr:hypothetical protein [Paracoccaceae bacterium]